MPTIAVVGEVVQRVVEVDDLVADGVGPGGVGVVDGVGQHRNVSEFVGLAPALHQRIGTSENGAWHWGSYRSLRSK